MWKRRTLQVFAEVPTLDIRRATSSANEATRAGQRRNGRLEGFPLSLVGLHRLARSYGPDIVSRRLHVNSAGKPEHRRDCHPVGSAPSASHGRAKPDLGFTVSDTRTLERLVRAQCWDHLLTEKPD